MAQRKLFAPLAANLKACCSSESPLKVPLVIPDNFPQDRLGEVVLCPLCLRVFDEDDLQAKRLTEEHIVPSGRGAANLTLTCVRCNNTTGSTLDAHLRKRIKHEENFARDGGPIRVQYRVGDGEQNAELFIKREIDEDGQEQVTFEVIGLPKQSNPELQAKLIAALTEPNIRDGDFKYCLGYVHVLGQTAMLRSAYLAMFRQFGYSYILHPALERVRRQIWQPITRENQEATITEPILLNGICQVPSVCRQTQILQIETPVRGFAVVLSLSRALPYCYMVFVPGPRDDGYEPLAALPVPEDDWQAQLKRAQGEADTNFTFNIYPDLSERLSDERTCHLVRELWAEVRRA